MKKISRITLLGLVLLLMLPMTTNVFASSEIVDIAEEEGIYVTNPLLNNNTKQGLTSLTSNIIEGEKTNIGGGLLWPTWNGGSTFRANYYHGSETHRSSATNSMLQRVRSSWTAKGYTAVTDWLTQTINQNKINYNII